MPVRLRDMGPRFTLRQHMLRWLDPDMLNRVGRDFPADQAFNDIKDAVVRDHVEDGRAKMHRRLLGDVVMRKRYVERLVPVEAATIAVAELVPEIHVGLGCWHKTLCRPAVIKPVHERFIFRPHRGKGFRVQKIFHNKEAPVVELIYLFLV